MMFSSATPIGFERRPNSGFIVPSEKFIDVGIAAPRTEVRGEFKLVKHRKGVVLLETPWFDNIILDNGLNRWGPQQAIVGAAIGTGTSPALATQTGLEAEATYTVTDGTGNGTVAYLGVSPYTTTRTYVKRTALGALNGNYTEVAVGWTAGSGVNKFSRALIVNGAGVPVAIPVGSAEQLDIWYRLVAYPPLVDINTTCVISGVTYNVVGRASEVGTISWTANASTAQNASPGGGGFHRAGGSTSVLGAITSSPSASNGAIGESKSYLAYVDLSLSLTQQVTWPLTVANEAGGIKTVAIAHTSAKFQYSFTPIIPKDATKQLVLFYSYSWARRP